jgi:hypothetical protein
VVGGKKRKERLEAKALVKVRVTGLRLWASNDMQLKVSTIHKEEKEERWTAGGKEANLYFWGP